MNRSCKAWLTAQPRGLSLSEHPFEIMRLSAVDRNSWKRLIALREQHISCTLYMHAEDMVKALAMLRIIEGCHYVSNPCQV